MYQKYVKSALKYHASQRKSKSYQASPSMTKSVQVLSIAVQSIFTLIILRQPLKAEIVLFDFDKKIKRHNTKSILLDKLLRILVL